MSASCGGADSSRTTFAACPARWFASPPTVMPAQALSSSQRRATSGWRIRSAATRATSGNSSSESIGHASTLATPAQAVGASTAPP